MKTTTFIISGCLLLSTCLMLTLSANAQSVSAGSLHSLFLCSDSIPRACGTNVTGQLGVGSAFSYRSTPAQVVGLTQITEISAASNMSLFLKVDGTVWACGDNQYGELGNATFSPHYVPTQITSLSNIIAVSAGGGHSLFLKDDGTVWACGNNQIGQLGDGTNDNRTAPVQIPSLTDIVGISAGGNHSVFLKNDGTVYLCGFFAAQNTPVLIPSLTDIIKVSASHHFTLFLKNDGTAMGLGSNLYGQLGDGTTDNAATPVAVNTLTGIVDLKAGPMGNSYFVKNDGTVWVCGINNYGQFGTGVNDGFTPHPDPFQLTALSDIIAVTTGLYHSVYVKSDETAQSSGGNSQGQLGNSSTNFSWSLVPVTNMCSFSTTGIMENEHISSVSVFPNPSSGNFVVSVDAELTFEKLEIYNLLGDLVYATTNIQQEMQIDLSHQPKGIYFVKLENGVEVSTQKFVLQ